MKPAGGFTGDLLASLRMLTPLSGGAVSVLVVTSHNLFADESCTHSSAFATVVAGYLAVDKHWRPFHRAYLKAHREARLTKPFHMTHFVTPDHEDYAHLTRSEKKLLIGRVGGAICNTQKTGFIIAIVHADYEAVFPKHFRKRIRHPYIFGVQAFTKHVASWAPDALPRGDKVFCVFARQKRLEARVDAAYREIANPIHDPHGYLYSDCAIIDTHEAAELVAADVLANCWGRFVKKPEFTLERSEDPTLFRLLTNKHLGHCLKVYDRGDLEELRDSMLARGVLSLKKPEAS